jgi:hypothetical protein
MPVTCQHRDRLRNPVHDIGNAEDSRASFLRYLHRADRTGDVMRAGRVIEQGTHVELMHRKGEYASLYRLQAAQYEHGEVS